MSDNRKFISNRIGEVSKQEIRISELIRVKSISIRGTSDAELTNQNQEQPVPIAFQVGSEAFRVASGQDLTPTY